MNARMKFAALFAALLVMCVLTPPAATAQSAQPTQAKQAKQTAAQQTPGAPGKLRRGVAYREYRVGGRLERVVVVHKHGLIETYRNNRADTLWTAAEDALGEVPNMRRWILRSW